MAGVCPLSLLSAACRLSRPRLPPVCRRRQPPPSAAAVSRRRQPPPSFARCCGVARASAVRCQISVVGVPKSIDNDVLFVDRTFGFDSAVEAAAGVIRNGWIEATSCATDLT
jgi:6-phosphofructokinase